MGLETNINLFPGAVDKTKCQFVTSSEIYKKMEEKQQKRNEKKLAEQKKVKMSANKMTKKHESFIQVLEGCMKCVSYIEDYMKTSHSKLDKRYTYVSIASELALIHNHHKLDFIKTKLFEILLKLSFTDRTAVLFNDDDVSRKLRNLWYNSKVTYKKDLGTFDVSTLVTHDVSEETLISDELSRSV